MASINFNSMLTYLTKPILFFTLLLTLLLSSQATTQAQTFSCSNVTEIPQAECQELVTLYNSTNGVNWTNNTGWLITNTPCSWYGITCEEGQVIDISLGHYGSAGNNLSGTLPNLNLPNLQGLYLYSNQLTGTIPDFSNLTKLTDLSLSDNQLTGNIPEFSNLPNLEYFDAVSNKLTGNIPSFSNQPNLIGLALDNNQLIGHIPSFSNLSKLQYLFLSYNQLVGLVPNLNWSDFYQISLSQNCGLVAVDATQAAILDSKDPNWQVRNLECYFKVNPLNLTFTKLSADRDPLPQIVTISYSNTVAMTWTVTISNAPWLNLDVMQGTTPSTVTMSVNSTGLSEGIYQGQVEFQSEVGVQVVTTTLTFFSCSGVTEIPQAECQELVTLYNTTHGVDWTNNTGWLTTNTPCSWYGIICKEGHVTEIILGDSSCYASLGNNLKGTLPDLNLASLQKLCLSGNQLTGNIPDFSNLPHLTYLSLSDNQFTGTLPNFSNLPNLEYFDAVSNKLTGHIPSFSNLTHLIGLALDNNQLIGEIPDFASSPKLQYLFLSLNDLMGNIPDFSNLPNLQAIIINHNKLTGFVPNLNWSNIFISFSQNCDLVPLDAAQAKVLDSKDSYWRDHNPDCPFQANPPNFTFNMFLGDSNLSPTQEMTINYGDTTTVTWTATMDNTPWLSLDAMQGTAPSKVKVRVNPSGLLAGNYSGKIIIVAGDEINSRQTVMVNLTIDEIPTPTVVPTLTPTPLPLPATPNPHGISTVIPPGGGVLTSTHGSAIVQFPNGFITQPITVSLTTLTQTTHVTTAFKFTSHIFDIIATNSQNQSVTQFDKPFTIIFGYQDSDWSNIAQEIDLSVYYWSIPENRWINLLPCTGCRHDTVNNQFEIRLNHLTEFALLVVARQRFYLPVIMR